VTEIGPGAEAVLGVHAYRVGWLKHVIDRTIDMIKLVGLCDVPRLYLQCARLAAKVFTAIEWYDG
jgi:hypothetical protein